MNVVVCGGVRVCPPGLYLAYAINFAVPDPPGIPTSALLR